MSQSEPEAIEVTDPASAAQALEQKWTEAEQPEGDPDGSEETQETNEEETSEASDVLDDEQESEEESNEDSNDESDDQEAETSEESSQFESTDDLAEALEMTTDEFLSNIKAKIKIDGEESEITLSELRDGYQREADYRRKTMDLAEKRKAFETESTGIQEQYTQKLGEVELLLNSAEQTLMQEFNGINWADLEQHEPEQWAIQRQKFNEKYQSIQSAKVQAGQESQRVAHEQQVKFNEERETYRTQQVELMIDKIPEWSDTTVKEKEQAELVDFIQSEYGFDAETINNTLDHRFIVIARDAMKGKQSNQKTNLAKKRVKKLPKITKPSAKPNKTAEAKKAQQSKLARYKKSGSNQDLAEALLDRM